MTQSQAKTAIFKNPKQPHSAKKPPLIALSDLRLESSYAGLPENFYHRVQPNPLTNPHLVSVNAAVAQALHLDINTLQSPDVESVLTGASLLQGSQPLAMKYAGHQFGVYNPALGDGRGILLGEIKDQSAELWDVHLKGAGKTDYSRFGDGRAVLRSSIREYLVGEAMHALGIPTTRALCLLSSDDTVLRDGMSEPCALLWRVTQCHIRFGHFEHFYYSRQNDDLKRLADYCIGRYFPELSNDDIRYLKMFKATRNRSVEMIAKWQAYGFVHGVMNTDNMSILGETFDYGPYAFMDGFNLNYVSNTSDHERRYAFKKQPDIMLWNLSCLAQSLLPLVEHKALIAALNEFNALYLDAYYHQMRVRLGLEQELAEDRDLIDDLVRLMQQYSLDMHRLFRSLCFIDKDAVSLSDALAECDYLNAHCLHSQGAAWLEAYFERLQTETAQGENWQQKMLAINPCYVLRNYMLEEAIKAAYAGDYTKVNALLELVSQPFAINPAHQGYAGAPPDWASGIHLSCSS